MLNNERVIALIPARGGSKGIPRKNEQDLGGHPLIAWSIKVANACSEVDRVIVSTEDSSLSNISKEFGAEVYERPDHLASDTATVHDVILQLRDTLRAEGEKAKYMLLLEPTSPFRDPGMISNALKLLNEGHNSVASFCRCHTHPAQSWKIENSSITPYIDNANAWVNRQSLPDVYELTGEVYVFELDTLRTDSASLLVGSSAPLILDADMCVDINYPRDLDFARLLFKSSPLARNWI